MLSLSNVSPAQGETYYKSENYYSNEESQQHSQWTGKGAENLGLFGEVDFDSFSNLLHGKAPAGTLLPGRHIKAATHRAGIDLTFSAPKSISIAALVGGDRRLEEAHRIAVQNTLTHVEEYHAQTRMWDGRKQYPVTTGNLIVAQFHHDTSRELDPQLHTHCVAISSTQTANGKWKALTNESIYRNSKLLGSIYENELAYEVKKLGYEIEKRPHCMFELKGYSDAQLEHFSKRRQQILEYAGANATAKEKQWATLRTRAAKGQPVPRELLHQMWESQSQQANLNLHHPVPDLGTDSPANETELACESVDSAVEHCAERRSAFRRTSLQKFVLEEIQPFNLEALESAIAEHPDLLPTVDSRFTTERALNREQATIVLMQNERGQVTAIASQAADIESYLEKENLTAGQQEAIWLTATTTDRFIAWQGVAGAGKTTALSHVKHLAEVSGYRLEGCAPSAEAAKVLGNELGIKTNTVASLLLSPSKQPNSNAIWVVDEASLLGAKDAQSLLNRATREQARVILVGDVRQLSAVEAGHPFRSLQQAGMQTAHLEESLRQRTPDLKAAVDAVARGEVKAGLERLERFNRVEEISDESDRCEQMVKDYLSLSPEEREQTLLLAGTNAERKTITARLREELKREGQLGQTATLIRLKPKDLTEVQSRFSRYYREGDIVIPTRHYNKRNLFRTEQYTVTQIEGDRLQLEGTDGRRHEVDPMSFRKRAYRPEAIEIAVGDRLRWTRNDKESGHRNGQQCRVLHIDPSSQIATLQYGNGQTESLSLAQTHHLDTAWVSTIHSSQGKTAKRALVVTDRAVGQESFYVAVSRVKEELKIYTSNRDQLLERAQTSQAQENPSEVLQQTPESQTYERSITSRGAPSRTAESVAEPEQLQLGFDLSSPAPDIQARESRDPTAEPRSAGAHPGDRSIGTAAAGDADRGERQQSSPSGIVGDDQKARYDERIAERIARHRRIREKRRDLARQLERNPAETGSVDPAAIANISAGERRPGEPTEIVEPSDSSPAQRQTVESQDRDRDGAVYQPVEHSAQPVSDLLVRPPSSGSVADSAENQRTGEQFGAQPAQDSGAGELEESRSLARMEQLSDDQLLQLALEVARNRDRLHSIRAARPSPDEKVRLQSQSQELEVQFERLSDRLQEQRADLETLEPRRSFWYPFGSPAKEVDAAEARVQSTLGAMRGLKHRLTEVQQQLDRWEHREQVYLGRIAPSIHLLQAERDLALAPVQARLNRIKTERQRQQEIQRVTGQLDCWKEIAATLGKSEAYLARIEAVKAEVQQGKPLSEAAIRTREQDWVAYREMVMSEPGILQEFERVVSSIGYVLGTYGQTQTGGSQVYQGENWRIEQWGNVLEVRNRQDGSAILKVEGREATDYKPTPAERQQLLELTRAVAREQQVQNQPQRGKGLSC